jgi:hypothetical protein
MALLDLALSFMAFPQNWDGSGIELNILLLPSSDPTVKLLPGGSGPPFSGTSYKLQVVFIPGLGAPPVDGDPTSMIFPITTPVPASASTLFNKLKAKLAPVPIPPTSMAGVNIHKALPPTYTSAFSFEQPRDPRFFSLGEDFGCSMRSKDPKPSQPPPPPTVSWGQIMSYVLRQPKLAAAVGMVYTPLRIAPLAATDVADGGWLYVRFDPASNPYTADLATKPDLIKLFAARIPPLTTARTLFAPLLFPVSQTATPPGIDEANIEVQEYDDGFAKIVHCFQPTSADAAIGDQNQLVAATDAGIQLGWDDEQVTIWHNRQLDGARSTSTDSLPLGVLGYRVDVRKGTSGLFTPLCLVQATINFDPSIDGTLNMEAPIEPAPTRALVLGGDPEPWLPRYFAQWRGTSLIAPDPVPYQLTGGNTPFPATIYSSLVPPDLLRYGNTYQFQTRLVDLTQGGPAFNVPALHPSPSPVGTCKFQRFIHPRKPRVETVPAPVRGGAVQTITQISVWRPLLGYPEFLFAGVSSSVLPTLISRVAAAKAANQVLGANDPDVDTLRIIVEAKAPAHDISDPGQLDGPFRLVYQLDTPFPAPPADPLVQYPPDPAQAIVLNPVHRDVADIANLNAPVASNPQSLPIPRARDVRIRLMAVAHNSNPDYFGDPSIQVGLTSSIDTRSDQGQEVNLLDPNKPLVDEFRAMLFQPANDIPQRLALELGLQVNGLQFSGPPGERVAFGASKALKHDLAGDYSAITFAAQNELLDHWIAVIILDMDRDWTWDGLQDPSFTVFRDGNPNPPGYLTVRQTVSASAITQPAQRNFTRLVFFDAVDPNPPASPPGQFPVAPTVSWSIVPNLVTGLTTPDPPKSLSITLPKSVRPTQTPVIASAGIALSPYQPSADYSSTAPRQRSLWIEFEQPLADPADGYFARVLAYGPDPLLAFGPATAPDALAKNVTEPPISLDPEPMRLITPGQTADKSGLDAMAQLVPALTPPNEKPRHFLLPLPSGVPDDDPQLFGFWTYDLRVGHTGDGLANWSTAQGRYGSALRVTGVQHPAPQLKCMVSRNPTGIQAVAPFATPVLNGQKTFSFFQPYTKLWALLYAQVTQADGASQRNVLLLTERLDPLPDQVVDPNGRTGPSVTRDVYGVGFFSQKDDKTLGKTGIETVLNSLLLPLNSPLSVLAVELLPTNGPFDRPVEGPGGPAPAQDPQGIGPLDNNLGGQRILRTSPLIAVPPIC